MARSQIGNAGKQTHYRDAESVTTLCGRKRFDKYDTYVASPEQLRAHLEDKRFLFARCQVCMAKMVAQYGESK